MTDRSGLSGESVAGGPVRHVPVLLDEVLSALAPRPGSAIVDGTFGAGGYSEAILKAGANVVAIDRDPSAIAAGEEMMTRWRERLVLVRGEFADLDEIARENGIDAADGVVLDIGVSSMQLDEAERGFSFRQDGPLDMRMSGEGPSAADVVNHVAQNDLLRIIGILGEEKHAPRVARAITERRASQPFERTLDLASVVEKAVGRAHGDRIHPATRTFQGLRIFVNRELEQLAAALSAAERLFEGRRTARRRNLPFAGRPDRQALPRRPKRFRQRIAASAGSRAPGGQFRAHPARRGCSERGRSATKPSRPVGKAALRNPHLGARLCGGLVSVQAAQSRFVVLIGKGRP